MYVAQFEPSAHSLGMVSLVEVNEFYDGSNWADYQPRIERALGSWRHALGAIIAPKPYAVVGGVYVTADGKTLATEKQIEVKKTKMQEYERKEYLAQHVILSTTSTHLGSKIKNLMMAKEMWETVKDDVTTKSSLYILDAEDQLASMKLAENEDLKAHLNRNKAALPIDDPAS